jgi:hypothetical protein
LNAASCGDPAAEFGEHLSMRAGKRARIAWYIRDARALNALARRFNPPQAFTADV